MNHPTVRRMPGQCDRRDLLRRLVAAACGAEFTWLTASESVAAAWPHELQLGWLHIHGDFPLNREPQLWHELSALRAEIPQRFELPPGREAIHIYLFRHRETFAQYLKRYFPTVPQRRALFIKQRGPGMVFAFDSTEFAVDLRHEVTHAVLHTVLPMVPLWLDEGLAEYYEVPAADRITRNPHLADVKRGLRWKPIPSLRTLEHQNDLREMDESDYRNAWAWVHFLSHGPAAARTALRDYLADLHARNVPGPISQRLAAAMPDWKSAFRAHFAAA